ncbi:unnamed protein product [Paramecium sonneborni]|uniref:Importin subunit alpha n=1 Tax=Paramecium sonneborni TaxID=65129 RepID=A0A8S1RIJ3_9CILI|nr:unnamed protein product [Paramecium sonneborni]
MNVLIQCQSYFLHQQQQLLKYFPFFFSIFNSHTPLSPSSNSLQYHQQLSIKSLHQHTILFCKQIKLTTLFQRHQLIANLIISITRSKFLWKINQIFLYIQNTTKNMKNTHKLSPNQKTLQIYNYQEMLQYEYMSQQLKDQLMFIIDSSNYQISIKDALEIIKSENFLETHKALIQLRKTLSVLFFQQFNKNFDQAEILTNELIPLLFYLIEFGSTYILKLEATQIISIFAGGKSDISRIIFENGIVRLSQTILKNNHPELSMLMMVILGKLAGDSIQYRDCILQVCNLNRIISNMQLRYEATYVWCLANLCIGRPSPKFEIIRPAFNIFMKVIMYEPTQTNIKMMNDAIWALGYMLDGEPTRIQILIDNGIIIRLIQLMHQCNFVSILRIFECIFQGSQEQISYLLECGFLSQIRNILDPKSREKSGNMLQTFAATETLFKVLSNQYFLISLFHSLMGENQDIRGDALEMIGNAVQHGTNEDVNQMVKNKLIQSILGMLELSQIKEIQSHHLKKGLEILIKVLRKGEIRSKDRQNNQYFTLFIEIEGKGVIQKLLSSKQDDVAKYAYIFKQEFTI